jgi:hypothetical protein
MNTRSGCSCDRRSRGTWVRPRRQPSLRGRVRFPFPDERHSDLETPRNPIQDGLQATEQRRAVHFPARRQAVDLAPIGLEGNPQRVLRPLDRCVARCHEPDALSQRHIGTFQGNLVALSSDPIAAFGDQSACCGMPLIGKVQATDVPAGRRIVQDTQAHRSKRRLCRPIHRSDRYRLEEVAVHLVSELHPFCGGVLVNDGSSMCPIGSPIQESWASSACNPAPSTY